MPGLLRGVARTAAIAGTATAVSNRVSRRQAGRWAAEDQRQGYEQPAAPVPGPARRPGVLEHPGHLGPGGELRQLGELRDSGVLTEEEFAAQKARVLGS